jgi:hypothetical protein
VAREYVGVLLEIFIKIGVEILIKKEFIKRKKRPFIAKNT